MKFSGKIGYVMTVEIEPGVWTDRIIEKFARGDIINKNFRLENPNQINPNINIDNRVSIVADQFSKANLGFMRYVLEKGVKWEIKSANFDPDRPRIILTLGGLYNG